MSREFYDLGTVLNINKYKIKAIGKNVEASDFSAEVSKNNIVLPYKILDDEQASIWRTGVFEDDIPEADKNFMASLNAQSI